MYPARQRRIDSRQRPARWHLEPLRIEELECINCDRCIPACPPQFGAIVKYEIDVVIIPELCSGCDKCLAACPVDCIYPFPNWETIGYPNEWWSIIS